MLELLTHKPLATNTVVYLALWGTLAVLRGLWGSLCESPDSVGAPAWLLRMQAGRKLWDAVSTAAGSAQRMDAGVLAFLAHLLSFVPVLVLGFLFQEGAPQPAGARSCLSSTLQGHRAGAPRARPLCTGPAPHCNAGACDV